MKQQDLFWDIKQQLWWLLQWLAGVMQVIDKLLHLSLQVTNPWTQCQAFSIGTEYIYIWYGGCILGIQDWSQVGSWVGLPFWHCYIPIWEQGGSWGPGITAVPAVLLCFEGFFFYTSFPVSCPALEMLISVPTVECPQGRDQHGSNT